MENEIIHKCQICSKELDFNKPKSVAQHIIRNHNIKPEEYYYKYIKTSEEGICKLSGCNNPTTFISIKKGYYDYCCVKHGSLDSRDKMKKTCEEKYGYSNVFQSKETKEKALKVRRNNKVIKEEKEKQELLDSIDSSDRTQCQICGLKLNNGHSVGLHLEVHSITSQDYYNQFFKTESEGICPISNKETTFISIERGYRDYAYGHAQKSKEVIDAGRKGNKEQLKRNLEKVEIEKEISILNKDKILNENLVQYEMVKAELDILCTKCNNTYKSNWMCIRGDDTWGRCPICYPKNSHASKSELELLEYIKSIYTGKISNNVFGLIKDLKTGKSLEIDIYLPDEKLGFEMNGLYWHCEINKPDPYYHLNKALACNQNKINLIQIFEDEWLYKRDIVKSRVAQICKVVNNRIHARDCIIKEILPDLKNIFLETYHIQGSDSSSIKLGAFHNNELVSVMTFSHGNISKGSTAENKLIFELNRFCIKSGVHIPGIASKLLSHFKNNYKWEEIYSYADRRWSQGRLYSSLGFSLEKKTSPNYWYVEMGKNKRHHRFNYKKRPHEPKDIPEWKLRSEEGLYRIWDCGSYKFILRNK